MTQHTNKKMTDNSESRQPMVFYRMPRWKQAIWGAAIAFTIMFIFLIAGKSSKTTIQDRQAPSDSQVSSNAKPKSKLGPEINYTQSNTGYKYAAAIQSVEITKANPGYVDIKVKLQVRPTLTDRQSSAPYDGYFGMGVRSSRIDECNNIKIGIVKEGFCEVGDNSDVARNSKGGEASLILNPNEIVILTITSRAKEGVTPDDFIVYYYEGKDDRPIFLQFPSM